MHRSLSPRGQASADYVALLALVAVLLAGAGAAATLDAVPARVARAVRTGLCIVGGDVCRPVDAAAAGLAPCVLGERAEGRGLTVTVASVRLGRAGEWTVARRSNGSVLVTGSREERAGLGGGLGLELGAVEVGVSGALDLTVARGRTWELPSVAAASRLLAALRSGSGELPPPTWRFGAAGEELSGEAAIAAAGLDLTGVEATAAAAAGARVGRGQTTLYLHTDLDVSARLAGLPGAKAGVGGPLLVSLTRERGVLREIAFRRVQAAAGGALVETVGRLDLRVPANRAAAAPLLARRLPWPPGVARDLRAVVRQTAAAGTIERSVYAVEDRSREVSAAARLGTELGVEAGTVDVRRRLVDASAWTAGSPERRRADCLPDAA